MPGSDVALPPVVVDEVLVYTYNEGVDDIGFQDVVKLVLALGEAFDAVTQAFVRLAFAPREFPRRAEPARSDCRIPSRGHSRSQ